MSRKCQLFRSVFSDVPVEVAKARLSSTRHASCRACESPRPSRADPRLRAAVTFVVFRAFQAPRSLFERDPGHDRGMVARSRATTSRIVASQAFRADSTLPRGVAGISSRMRIPEAVGPVESTWLVGFDVNSQSVQSHGLGDDHVALEEVVVGGRVESLGVERLIERGAEVQRLAVEQDRARTARLRTCPAQSSGGRSKSGLSLTVRRAS